MDNKEKKPEIVLTQPGEERSSTRNQRRRLDAAIKRVLKRHRKKKVNPISNERKHEKD